MRRVTYAGGTFLTGDRIADALLDYAAQIARADSADHLVVPTIGPGGERGTVDVVLGPASQLLAERENLEISDVEDAAFVEDLERRGRLAGVGRADQVDPRSGG